MMHTHHQNQVISPHPPPSSCSMPCLSKCEDDNGAREVPRPIARRVLTCGSAFTGWCSDGQAFVVMGIPVTHVFGCDCLPASKNFCTSNFVMHNWYPDVLGDEFAHAPPVMFFFLAPAFIAHHILHKGYTRAGMTHVQDHGCPCWSAL